MKVRFLTPAEIEMFEASVYYEMQAYDLGANFLDIFVFPGVCRIQEPL